MFSYTDEAIVTSSPTGRHLSTIIRALPGVPTYLWRQHAEAVCKVLNETRPTDRISELIREGYMLPETWIGRQGTAEEARDFAQQSAEIRRDALIESLERELADAHEKLKAPIKLPNRKSIDHYCYDQGANCNATGWNSCLDSISSLNPNRTFKRVG